MRFLLVGPDLESNLSLGYLASSLTRAGHAAEIVAFSSEADTVEVLRRAQAADAVGLSLSFQVRAPEFLELAAALKTQSPTRPVIAGGHFASCAAHELLRDFPALDLIVLHEGEESLVELAALGSDLLGAAHRVRGVVTREARRSRAQPSSGRRSRISTSLPPPDRSGPASPGRRRPHGVHHG